MSDQNEEFCFTLEEAIDAAREAFLDSHAQGSSDTSVEQLSVQKYIMQNGDEMWRALFLSDDDDDPGDAIPMLSGVAAQSVFDGDYEIGELLQEWQEENTLHEWDDGEFQTEPPLDTEEGQTAADEWDER
ncbi:MysB family protein [Shimwellia blattae]|uniref:Acidic protein MsyB n=1 Tax=Shimwellia blattae (strain ATCC 29907 / DSM 4481 / JCM 1650 / NBRC 105725 / CDC 9005-74) TaxID=630626 RepID=I2BAH1_SHIBC|nr:MysB family protein [Shimwellia blattae]AFJ47525.1 acidic protein MsyB [Shimwellia blattae DSM 4481 = NBRC 105725]GAB80284.1 acidic protein MsyB [Shimwellia blattae DSM 4481 = NBRC 105725]VDY65022.1 secY/secA suppressor protein [Shimwellia blattae]VEC23350.1 secY/secA suppressor protein [Shimwellia blattae]